MKTISLEAEQHVLGAVLINPQSLNAITDLITPSDFSNTDNEKIFRAMVELGAASEVLTIYEFIAGSGYDVNLGYIAELQLNTPSDANIKQYARIVKDKARLRSVLTAASEMCLAVGEDEGSSVDEVVSKAQSIAMAIDSEQASDGVVAIADALKDAAKEWNRRAELGDKIDGLETGWKSVDERLSGIRPGDLFIIAGRPSMGKTVMAMQMVADIAIRQNKKAIVFSLEMTKQQLIDRMAACVGKIPYDVLRKCDVKRFGEYQSEIMVAAGKIKSSGIFIDETGGLHINQICARARRTKAIYGLDLIVVDHIGLATSDGPSREREIANITGKLKQLAKELGVAVIGVSQLNRGVESRTCRRPLMSDLKDSGSIEQDADTVALLYRDEYYNKDSQNKGVVEVIFGKLRDGETGTDFLQSNLAMMRFDDMAPNYQPEASEPKKRFDY